jgi:hypothetical protein
MDKSNAFLITQGAILATDYPYVSGKTGVKGTCS